MHRRGRLKDRRKGVEGSFLDPVRFATMSGGPKTGVLHEYNDREKSSIIRARSTYRREMRERWKEDGEVASSGPWTMAYAYISPDWFFRKMESMSLPRRCNEEKVGFRTGFPVTFSNWWNTSDHTRDFEPLWKTNIFYSRFKFLAEVRQFRYFTKLYFTGFRKLRNSIWKPVIF